MCLNHRNMWGETEIIQTPTKELIMLTPWFNEIINPNATSSQIETFSGNIAKTIENKWETTLMNTPWFNEIINQNATSSQIEAFASNIAKTIENKWEDK
jgi:formylmethanofuran dehydrogenase subunit D